MLPGEQGDTPVRATPARLRSLVPFFVIKKKRKRGTHRLWGCFFFVLFLFFFFRIFLPSFPLLVVFQRVQKRERERERKRDRGRENRRRESVSLPHSGLSGVSDGSVCVSPPRDESALTDPHTPTLTHPHTLHHAAAPAPSSALPLRPLPLSSQRTDPPPAPAARRRKSGAHQGALHADRVQGALQPGSLHQLLRAWERDHAVQQRAAGGRHGKPIRDWLQSL